GDLLDDVVRFCDQALSERSVYAVLHRERDRLFPDELFADVFSDRGRRSVPPSVVATVMVLQRLEGLSDREAVERYAFDARWRYAAGVGGYDCGGWGRFAHTVLVDMRARLAASDDPRRIFKVTVAAAAAAGLVGARRVLDSTPLYDAVATMDTVTLIRSAILGLLRVADEVLETELRAVLTSGDGYASAAKPQIDWDDRDARDALIDSRARDAFACLAWLDGRALGPAVAEAAQLVATVVGQDLEETADGVFRIARRVAKDRVISTVDPQARHGHKTSARGFDGYKGHVAVDPDSEIITDTVVSAGNAGDATVAADLIDDLLDDTADGDPDGAAGAAGDGAEGAEAEADRATVYGDAAYGAGEFLQRLAEADIDSRCKTQPPTAPGGRFAKDRFDINLDDDTVTCPAGVTVTIRRSADGEGTACFAGSCGDCPLRPECTTAVGGRSIRVGRYEQRLADARGAQQDPGWVADYRATRPKVERKLGHLMRRRHGGRRARMRGRRKVDADFNLLTAAHNLARLGVLGLRFTSNGWVTA
ncbi:MAG: IS1182 family transposase, partial [Pseudonocardiaceae bacterium]